VLSDPPAIDATADKSVPQTPQEIAATIPAASGPPANTPSATSDQATAPPAVTSAPLVKAQVPIAVPTDAPAPVSDDGKRTAGGLEPTISSGMLIMCALILGIALLRVMWRITRKYAAARRDKIFTDDSWSNPYDDPEFCRKLRKGVALHPSWEREDTTINQLHLGV
jgi:hypothetical protein